MKVFISVVDDENYDIEVDVSHLNYNIEDNNFWMSCVMGDDWLQRVNSSQAVKSKPCVVTIKDKISFIVFNNSNDADNFYSWLIKAEDQVREGYRTMRG